MGVWPVPGGSAETADASCTGAEDPSMPTVAGGMVRLPSEIPTPSVAWGANDPAALTRLASADDSAAVPSARPPKMSVPSDAYRPNPWAVCNCASTPRRLMGIPPASSCHPQTLKYLNQPESGSRPKALEVARF